MSGFGTATGYRSLDKETVSQTLRGLSFLVGHFVRSRNSSPYDRLVTRSIALLYRLSYVFRVSRSSLMKLELWEVTMLRVSLYSTTCAVALAAALAFSANNASAQRRVSYERAWAICKKEVTAMYPSEGSGTAGRYARGMSCMQRYGYVLKRSSRAELRNANDDDDDD